MFRPSVSDISAPVKWLSPRRVSVRWIVFVYVAAALSLGATAVVAWRRRAAPAANWFAGLTGILALGAAIVGAAIAGSISNALVLWTTVAVGLVAPIPWLFFSLAYTGRTEFGSAGVASVVSVLPGMGLLATSLVFGSQVLPGLQLPSQRAATGSTALLVAVLNITQWLGLFYAGGLVFVGAGLLLWTFHRYEYLDSNTGVLVGTLGTVPWLSVLFALQLTGTAPWALSRTLGAGLFVGGVVAVGLIGPHRLFDRVAAAGNVGPETVVEDLTGLVVVTDSTGSIVDRNESAHETLGSVAGPMMGASVTDVLGSDVAALRQAETIELPAGAGKRLFEPTVSDLSDQQGHRLGHAIVLRDVTDRRIRQQRLEVFNRVLRHNLRNKMTVTLGSAEAIQAAVEDSDIAERAQAIVDSAGELTALSNQARDIERVMTPSAAETEPARLRTLVNSAFEAEDRTDITLTHDLPGGVTIETSTAALELALTNLVENAVQYNEASDPMVEVSACYERDRQYPLTITVADNGPGIPEQEVRAVEAGSESALEHTSGLGLWVVRWVAMRLHGEVSFRDREPRGTVVALRLGAAVRREPDRRPASALTPLSRS